MYFGLILATLLAILAGLVIGKCVQKVNYWKRNNVELISIWDFIKKTRHLHWSLVIDNYYQQMYVERKPFKVIEGFLISVVIVQDLASIKDIMITKFKSFPERGFYVNPRDRLSNSILRLGYEKWKPLRDKLAPSMAPGKLKYMFPTLSAVASDFVAVIGDKCEGATHQMEIYDLCARFTSDIVGTAIFGLNCNNLREEHTEFRIQGHRSLYQLLHPCLELFASKYSKLMQLLNFKVFDKKTTEFFTRVFQQTVEERERHNIRKRDLVDILIQMKSDGGTKEEELPMTMDLMVAQLFGFFQAGFETSASTMTFALYELAKNPQVQERARLEVLEIMAKYDNNITYENLKELKYLKQVITETLRKYPSVPGITRMCHTACTLETSGGSLTIQPGTSVLIPYYGLHHNPIYYPEPEVFRPERFDDAELAKQAYLPFGAGPKMCLGELFAKLQISLGLASLLSQFRVSMCEQTPDTLTFDPKSMTLLFVKGGVYLNVEKL